MLDLLYDAGSWLRDRLAAEVPGMDNRVAEDPEGPQRGSVLAGSPYFAS
jgi:hypothetical protein